MIFNEGYSYNTKKIAREKIERLKEQNQQEIIIRKQKIKELSKQTNELRKKIKEKSKTIEKEEEERQATILENRKLKQRIATEKFQRIRDKQPSKGKKTGPNGPLKNGLYHVRGHVIEIKDGIRVNSMKTNEAVNKGDEFPAKSNQSYAPNSYLTNHLSKLINTDLSQVRRQSSDVNDLEHHGYEEHRYKKEWNDVDENNNNNNVPMIADVLHELQSDERFPERKTNDESGGESDVDFCSADSLDGMGEEEEEQRTLKSSLKVTRGGLNDSSNRKVTFSDSIEFNNGDVGWLEIEPLERIPLYQQMQRKAGEEVNQPKKPIAHTPEEVIDQLREEALMSQFVETTNVNYPSAVSAAMEQLSQSKRIEREKIDNESSKISDIYLQHIQHKQESAFPSSTVNKNMTTEDTRSVDCGSTLEQSKVETSSTLKNEIVDDEMRNTGHQVSIDNKVNHSIPVVTSEYNQTHPHPPPIQSESDELSSNVSTGIFTSSKSITKGHSENVLNSSEGNCETSSTSAVLYVPEYPCFPSKKHRYTTRGVYDGRLPINDGNNSQDEIMSDQRSTAVGASVVTCNASRTENYSNNRPGKEPSLNYVNITGHSILRSDSRSKADNIYKEVEETLGNIAFPKSETNLNNNKTDPSICNGMNERLNMSDPISKRTSETPSSENKISNAVRDGSGIPVRVHSAKASPVRRGRVIVSADKKKRNQVGNMLPRPPDKPKETSNFEKCHANVTEDNTPMEERGLNDKKSDKVDDQIQHPNNNVYNVSYPGHNSLQTSVIDRTHKYLTNQQRIPLKTNTNFYSNGFSGLNNKQTDRSTPRYAAPRSTNPPRSHVRTNSLPWEKTTQYNNFSEVPLDKTPTDDEINRLWTNVRECIYTEQTEHAYSDSNYIIDNRSQRQYHNRSMSASSLNRRSSDTRPVPRIYANYTPANINRRYGSHDSLNQQIVGDRIGPIVHNKPPLLPHRASRVIRNSNSNNENKYTVFKGNDNLSNGHRYHYDLPHGKYVDVTTSMQSFLVLEELCKKQTLTPPQVDAVFEASNSIQRKIDKEKAGISALSIEERRVMESLERLNEKLKEKGYKAGGSKKVSPFKPPIAERRRLYPNQ